MAKRTSEGGQVSFESRELAPPGSGPPAAPRMRTPCMPGAPSPAGAASSLAARQALNGGRSTKGVPSHAAVVGPTAEEPDSPRRGQVAMRLRGTVGIALPLPGVCIAAMAAASSRSAPANSWLRYKLLVKALRCERLINVLPNTVGDIVFCPDGSKAVLITGDRHREGVTIKFRGRSAHVTAYAEGDCGSGVVWFDHERRLAVRDRHKAATVDFSPFRVSPERRDLWVVGSSPSDDVVLHGTWPDWETVQSSPLRLFVQGKYKRTLKSNEVIAGVDHFSSRVLYGVFDPAKLSVRYQLAASLDPHAKRIDIARVDSDMVPPAFLTSRGCRPGECLVGLGHDRWVGLTLYRVRGFKLEPLSRVLRPLVHYLGRGVRWVTTHDRKRLPSWDFWATPVLVAGDLVSTQDDWVLDLTRDEAFQLPLSISRLAVNPRKREVVVTILQNNTLPFLDVALRW